MHRRMSLGFALMLLFVCLAGVAPASAEPLSGPEPAAVESFDLLDWAWEWLTSLVGGGPGNETPGGETLNGFDGEGGGFMDPNGSMGNS